jgi:4-methylaminobutanoate oxidase (formaldehyde-forming)
VTERDHGLPPAAAAERLVDDTIAAAGVIAGAEADPPERARVVIVGGGLIGTAVAYHLARAGVTDCVLLERDRISCGTSWHPAGLLASARASHPLTELARISMDVYAGLEAESGLANGFNRRGCLTVARTAERLVELRYAAAMADHHGVPAHLLDPGEIAALHPLVDPDGLVGGVHFPHDGTVNPGSSALGMARCAAADGVRVLEGVRVLGLERAGGAVSAVRTDRGRIACETVVVCGGLWSAALVRSLGVPLALHAAEHVWMLTAPVEAPVWELPYVRDLDGHIYVRGYRDRLLVGAFEPDGKPRPLHTIGDDFSFAEFEPDLEHVAPSLERARERMPVLREVPIERHFNGPESFTPDNLPLVGEVPEVRGLFVAAGMNSQGVLLAPGVGRAVAEWVVAGAPTMDVAELHPGRFGAAQGGGAYLRARSVESLGRLYGMHWPYWQPTTARGLRRTPLHDRLAAAGACFGETAGWERANWYAEAGTSPAYEYSYSWPPFLDRVGEEHRAARERVALFDLSSFSKVEVRGAAALACVQKVFASDLDVPDGKVVYTTMLNRAGGVDVDLTVTRLAADRFLVVAPAITQRLVLGRLEQHAEGAGVVDVTSAYATIAVMGPESRTLLTRLTGDDLGNEAFPFGTARVIDLGAGPVLAVRVSFVGELGWELYPASELAATTYDAIVAAGADLGLAHAGYHALDSLRCEKGYRHWPFDVGPLDTPMEAGLSFTVAWDKPGFVGRDALLRRREQPRRHRLVHVRLDAPRRLLLHGESVLAGDRRVGRVTSGAYGHHLGAAVGLAAIEDPELFDLPAAEFAVDVARERVPATLSAKPFYDPGNERLRS